MVEAARAVPEPTSDAGPGWATKARKAPRKTNLDDSGTLTWWTDALDRNVKERNQGREDVLKENTKDALDRKPINCIPWHVLFAFCVWDDGGRLPTDAEFGFAAAGGEEQRPFPWGTVESTSLARIHDVETNLAPIFEYGKSYVTARLWDRTLGDGKNTFEINYGFTYGGNTMALTDNAMHIAPVGSKPLGHGKWGHADLAGGMFEWMLDEGPVRPGNCQDCANVNWPKGAEVDPNAFMDQKDASGRKWFENPAWWQGGARVIRGSAWDNAQFLSNTQSKREIQYFTSYPLRRTYRAVGGRCARSASVER
jgi:formylglycine-generating enzyme required for sulfatase activity